MAVKKQLFGFTIDKLEFSSFYDITFITRNIGYIFKSVISHNSLDFGIQKQIPLVVFLITREEQGLRSERMPGRQKDGVLVRVLLLDRLVSGHQKSVRNDAVPNQRELKLNNYF